MRRLYFLLFILLLSSCKKDKFHKETVTGIVLHNVTKQPLPNQTVWLTATTYKLGKKTDEFPGGTPVFTTKKYISSTNAAGNFVFNIEVDGEWTFSAEVVTGEYTQKIPSKNIAFIFPGNPQSLDAAKKTYDTLFAEKAGYVRYHIKNINDTHNNDTLLASTWYKLKWIRLGGNGYGANDYNLGYIGTAVDQLVIDTIPVESEPQIPIKWFHKRTDTIVLKNEMISVSAGNTSDYYIQY
jgi:hypothetical protein